MLRRGCCTPGSLEPEQNMHGRIYAFVPDDADRLRALNAWPLRTAIISRHWRRTLTSALIGPPTVTRQKLSVFLVRGSGLSIFADSESRHRNWSKDPRKLNATNCASAAEVQYFYGCMHETRRLQHTVGRTDDVVLLYDWSLPQLPCDVEGVACSVSFA